jgi:hypothetical protein
MVSRTIVSARVGFDAHLGSWSTCPLLAAIRAVSAAREA